MLTTLFLVGAALAEPSPEPLVLTPPALQRVLRAAHALPALDHAPPSVSLPATGPAQSSDASLAWSLAALTARDEADEAERDALVDALDVAYTRTTSPVMIPEVLRDLAAQPTDGPVPRAHVDRLRRVNGDVPAELVDWLAAGVPLLLGIEAPSGWRHAKRARWRPARGADPTPRAIVLVGYEHRGRWFLVRDAEGEAWARDGVLRVREDHLVAMTGEAYALHTVPDRVTPDALGDPNADDPRVSIGPLSVAQARQRSAGEPSSLAFSGTVRLPPGIGERASVVVRAYLPGAHGLPGAPVPATDARWQDGTGGAAAVSDPLAVGDGSTSFTVFLPYDALGTEPGRSPRSLAAFVPRPESIVVVPTLYVDGFPVADGDAMMARIMR